MNIKFNQNLLSLNFVLHAWHYHDYYDWMYDRKHMPYYIHVVEKNNKYYVFDIFQVHFPRCDVKLSLGCDKNLYDALELSAYLFMDSHKTEFDFIKIKDEIMACIPEEINLNNILDIMSSLHKHKLISIPKYTFTIDEDGNNSCQLFIKSVHQHKSVKVCSKYRLKAKKMAALAYFDYYILRCPIYDEINSEFHPLWFTNYSNTNDENPLNNYLFSYSDWPWKHYEIEEKSFDPHRDYMTCDEIIDEMGDNFYSAIENLIRLVHYGNVSTNAILDRKFELFKKEFHIDIRPDVYVLNYLCPLVNIKDVLNENELKLSAENLGITQDEYVEFFNNLQISNQKELRENIDQEIINNILDDLRKEMQRYLKITEKDIVDDIFKYENIDEFMDENQIEQECKDLKLTRDELQKHYNDLQDKHKEEYIIKHNNTI